jgi:hypothetical protein
MSKEFEQGMIERECRNDSASISVFGINHLCTDGWRPFTDQNGFIYCLTFMRKNVLNEQLEQYRIKVRCAPQFAPTNTFTPMANEVPDWRRRDSCAASSNKAMLGDFARAYVEESGPVLPPCPVPIYYFPKSHPFSHHAVLAGGLPRRCSRFSPNVRVKLHDPWAQTLQLFEADIVYDDNDSNTSSSMTSDSSDDARRTAVNLTRTSIIDTALSEVPLGVTKLSSSVTTRKAYALYTIFTRPRMPPEIVASVPASALAGFDFTWSAFTKFFKNRTGTDWGNAQATWRNSYHMNPILKGKLSGMAERGGAYDVERPDRMERRQSFVDGVGEESAVRMKPVKSIEAQSRGGSVTVVLGTDGKEDAALMEGLDVKAKTPEGGW